MRTLWRTLSHKMADASASNNKYISRLRSSEEMYKKNDKNKNKIIDIEEKDTDIEDKIDKETSDREETDRINKEDEKHDQDSEDDENEGYNPNYDEDIDNLKEIIEKKETIIMTQTDEIVQLKKDIRYWRDKYENERKTTTTPSPPLPNENTPIINKNKKQQNETFNENVENEMIKMKNQIHCNSIKIEHLETTVKNNMNNRKDLDQKIRDIDFQLKTLINDQVKKIEEKKIYTDSQIKELERY